MIEVEREKKHNENPKLCIIMYAILFCTCQASYHTSSFIISIVLFVSGTQYYKQPTWGRSHPQF